jgi:hypothetical protein
VSDRNGSDCKYVETFTHRVGSIGAPSRRTVFIRGTNAKQLEVPKTAGRNTNNNNNNDGDTSDNKNNKISEWFICTQSVRQHMKVEMRNKI